VSVVAGGQNNEEQGPEGGARAAEKVSELPAGNNTHKAEERGKDVAGVDEAEGGNLSEEGEGEVKESGVCREIVFGKGLREGLAFEEILVVSELMVAAFVTKELVPAHTVVPDSVEDYAEDEGEEKEGEEVVGAGSHYPEFRLLRKVMGPVSQIFVICTERLLGGEGDFFNVVELADRDFANGAGHFDEDVVVVKFGGQGFIEGVFKGVGCGVILENFVNENSGRIFLEHKFFNGFFPLVDEGVADGVDFVNDPEDGVLGKHDGVFEG